MKAIILAYQEHPEMRSATPVYTHDILDKPMINYAISACSNYTSTVIVNEIFENNYKKTKELANVVTTVDESTAYKTLLGHLGEEAVIIIDGNIPTMDNFAVEDFIEGCTEDGGKIITLEQKSAEYRLIFLYSGSIAENYNSFEELINNNEVREFEVPDPFQAYYPIKNRRDLSLAEDYIRENIIDGLLYSGVSIKNIGTVTIGPDVEIGQDTIVFPNTYITGKVSIGKNCKLGPFLRIRQSATLGNGVKLGNFVELKNATLGEKSASAHLSYLGDCTLGKQVNMGCGTITVNYDGVNKHHTTIEDDAFIGCNVNLIAPVTIGKASLVAAGSTVTKDVPAKTLSFARARQVNKEGYKKKSKK